MLVMIIFIITGIMRLYEESYLNRFVIRFLKNISVLELIIMIPVSTLGWINVIIIIFVVQIFVFKRLAIRSTFNLSKKN